MRVFKGVKYSQTGTSTRDLVSWLWEFRSFCLSLVWWDRTSLVWPVSGTQRFRGALASSWVDVPLLHWLGTLPFSLGTELKNKSSYSNLTLTVRTSWYQPPINSFPSATTKISEGSTLIQWSPKRPTTGYNKNHNNECIDVRKTSSSLTAL